MFKKDQETPRQLQTWVSLSLHFPELCSVSIACWYVIFCQHNRPQSVKRR